MNDVNNLAYSVTNAPKEIQEAIESNILYDQYSTPAELIEDLNKTDKITIVMVSHDIEAAKKYATHILHIGKEKCVFCTKHEFIKENGGCLF